MYRKRKFYRNLNVKLNGETVEVRPQQIPALRFGFLAALVFVLLSAGIAFGKESILNAFGDFDSFATKLSEGTDEVFSALGNGIKNYTFNSWVQ
ncbi:hypothetical protein KJ636_03385 [Patescibacteria group bacterium]|nr:hypothetical protein [Patescibacteria group bacterium]